MVSNSFIYYVGTISQTLGSRYLTLWEPWLTVLTFVTSKFKIKLVLMPKYEFFIHDSWWNAMIYFIHCNGKGFETSVFPVIPQKNIFCKYILNEDHLHEANLFWYFLCDYDTSKLTIIELRHEKHV